ncbi:hypothetical protein L1049_006512 [Liquidambar formosana]|uniref:Uncharacterized protein n=1 Tax=Liquidambar formosana TaxID=63359 RepID=A0AAP0RHF1_LIQFO
MSLPNVASSKCSFASPPLTYILEQKKPVYCWAEEGIARSDFPPSFKFGASTSAIQTESHPTDGGRGPSTWDSFIGDLPAIQSYTKYKEDVWCLKNMKADVYRFSISWPRILPKGKKGGGINQEGIDFYNNLIDELTSNGIKPFVTLFHFDLPSALQEDYNGFLSSNFVGDFNDFADICFNNFGDRVKCWATFNEPEVFCVYGYATNLSIEDDPTQYPYMAAHNLILAHATAVKTYRENYQSTQNGKIGMSLSAQWFLPLTNTPSDVSAANRAWDFFIGWFLDPMVMGDYPFSMKAIVRDRLPQFTEEEQELVKGSYDFVAINYYTSQYTKGLRFSAGDVPTSYHNDQYLQMLTEKDGVPIGPQAEGCDQIYVYPQGLGNILLNLKLKYNDPLIYITENGYPQKRDDSIPLEKALEDDIRIEFIKDHLGYVLKALRDGVNVGGYFIWALMDCMEVGSGYTVRYGLNYTDYSDDYKRIPKKSAKWLNHFLTSSPPKESTSKSCDASWDGRVCFEKMTPARAAFFLLLSCLTSVCYRD